MCGNEEIKSLCERYRSEQTVTWKQDGVEHTKTSQPLIDSQKALEEWKMLKKVVLAEQYARGCMWQLWKAIVTFRGKEFVERSSWKFYHACQASSHICCTYS